MYKKRAMCRLIEEKAGFAVKSPSDFTRLAELVFNETGAYISETTLKRLFGYIEGWQNPRPGVWNILARYVGLANEDAFVKGCGLDPESISGAVTADSVLSAELAAGSELELRWFPDRYMRVRHEGNGDFLILEAQGTRLEAGGRFHADSIVAHDALLLSPYTPPQKVVEPLLYEIGRTGGVELNLLPTQ